MGDRIGKISNVDRFARFGHVHPGRAVYVFVDFVSFVRTRARRGFKFNSMANVTVCNKNSKGFTNGFSFCEKYAVVINLRKSTMLQSWLATGA